MVMLKVVALWLLLISSVTSYPYSTIPNPTQNWESCGREKLSWVCDPNNYLKKDVADLIDFTLSSLSQNYTASCGKPYQIGVAIIKKLSDYGYDSSFDDAKKFAKSIHDSWGVGYSDCQSGIVLFASIEDRHVYISTGAIVKKIITDSIINDFITKGMISFFRVKDFDQAILFGIDKLATILSSSSPDKQNFIQDTDLNTTNRGEEEESHSIWVGILFIVAYLGLIFFGIGVMFEFIKWMYRLIKNWIVKIIFGEKNGKRK